MASDRLVAPSAQASAASPTEAAAPPKPRLYYLDHLRVVLTALVVLHHVSIAYSNIPAWYYIDPADDASTGLMDIFLVINQAFFMGLFFLISGFFTPGSHDRRGARSFLRGRLMRLGVPLLLYLVLVRPVVYLWIYLTESAETPYWLFYVETVEPGPLWFVETLLVFVLVYALMRWFWPPRATTAPAATDRPARPAAMPGPLAVTGFVAVLVAVTYLWRIAVPSGTTWEITGLPTPAFMPQYVLMFAVGALAFRRGWLNTVPRWAGWGGAGAALLMAPVYVLLVGALQDTAVPGSWETLVLAAAENILAVGAVLALLALFQRRFNHRSAFGTFLSDHAFAVFFLHPLALVGLGYAFSWWDAAAVVKFVVVAAIALPLCWGAAYLLRSLPRANRVF